MFRGSQATEAVLDKITYPDLRFERIYTGEELSQNHLLTVSTFSSPLILSCVRQAVHTQGILLARLKPMFILCLGLECRANRGFYAEAVLTPSHGCADIKELTAEGVYHRHTGTPGQFVLMQERMHCLIEYQAWKGCLLMDGTAKTACQWINVYPLSCHIMVPHQFQPKDKGET